MSERRHHHRHEGRLRRFLRAYRFEIIWLVVVAIGIFLIFERFSIRTTLIGWLGGTARTLFQGLGRLDDVARGFLARTTLSNAIGFVLIVGAAVAIIARARWRVMHNPDLAALRCPRCGGDIHRVHRTRLDHLISAFVPVRRYRCTKPECRWEGLRVGRHGRASPPTAPGS